MKISFRVVGSPGSVSQLDMIIPDILNHLGETAAIDTITNGTFKVSTTNNRPVITLLGNPVVFLKKGDVYTDAGATAFDPEDGDVTSDIVIVNSVDTSVVGTYTMTYDVNDSQDLDADQVTRTVNVIYATAGTNCLDAPSHEILQPINKDGNSVFKKGNTVPSKFRVCDANGNSVGTPGVVSSFKLIKKVFVTEQIVNEEVISTTKTDTAFRWDPIGQLWIFNINTNNLLASYTYTYRISLNDGTNIDFRFGLK